MRGTTRAANPGAPIETLETELANSGTRDIPSEAVAEPVTAEQWNAMAPHSGTSLEQLPAGVPAGALVNWCP